MTANDRMPFGLATIILTVFLICGFTVTPVVGAELTKNDFPCEADNSIVPVFWDTDVFTFSVNGDFAQAHVILCLDQRTDKVYKKKVKSKKNAIEISGKDVLAYLKENPTDAIIQESVDCPNGIVIDADEICAFLENNPDIEYIMLAHPDESYTAAIIMAVAIIEAAMVIPSVADAALLAADVKMKHGSKASVVTTF